MPKMIISVYDSRRSAEAARRRLLDHGFAPDQMRLEGGETPAPREEERKGLAGMIERMFSGLLLDDEVARYANAARGGKTVIALHVADESADKAAEILRTVSGEIGQPIVSEDIPSPPGAGQERAAAPDPLATLYGPQVYPLPNSPTGWGEAWRGEPSTIGTRANDPGRPQGLIEDAGGLGTNEVQRAPEKPKRK